MIAAFVLLLAPAASFTMPCGNCVSQYTQAVTRPVDATALTGIVRDVAGGIVPGASIIARTAGREQHTVSGPDGRFALNVPAAMEVVLIVRATGFAESRQTIAAGGIASELEIAVSPASVVESVTVTATGGERRTGDVPASVSLMSREEIKQSPAMVADDVLRQIPTFSLFRRTSSLASHPTAQGVSLRGIGPSGVSRTLVLLDGVPFNDPFGGWVYWSRVPLENADQIEVVEGTSSGLYGNYAMGGVINFITSPPAPRTFLMKAQYGNRGTRKVDFLGSHVWGKLRVALDGNVFDTNGYPIVRANERGLVDNNAAVRFWNLNLKADYAPTDRIRTFLRAGYFDESRDNGKLSTIDGAEEANGTVWTSASAGAEVRMPDESELRATVFADVERFHSNFLAVRTANSVPRSVGVMTLRQTVPTKGTGGMARWSRAFGTAHHLTVGTDVRWVDGDSEENGLDAATGTQIILRRVSGGTQRALGAFVQDLITPLPALAVTLSARVDRWRNYDGHNLEHSAVTGAPTANHIPALPDRQDTLVSPRVAARYHVTNRLDVWGDIGSGFRAPTLNELYRQFRVGSTLTLANNGLGPERLVGGEAGVTFAASRNLTIRSTWFDNHVTDPVSNVTLSSGATVTQQRQNLGETRIWGIQSDVEYRVGALWRLAGGYVYNQARVTENPANTALVGHFLPQVPAHRGSLRLAYTNPKYVTLAASAQFLGAQFDEDQNLASRRLPKYAVVDLIASRVLSRRLELFLGVQNLLDVEYVVGTLPTTVGSPRLVSGGIRLQVSGR